MKQQSSAKRFRFQTTEKKLMAISLFSFVVGAVLQVVYIVTFMKHSILVEQVKTYFLCESSGQDFTNSCNHSSFKKISYPETKVAETVLFSFHPLVLFMTFIFSKKDVKTLMKKLKIIPKRSHKTSNPLYIS